MQDRLADRHGLPLWQRLWQPWERFWFTPADPTVLALIRITCGMLVSYTLFVYSFRLQEFMGEDGWVYLPSRLEYVRHKPWVVESLWGYEMPPYQPPEGQFQEQYVAEYQKKYGMLPPPPYPINERQWKELDDYREKTKSPLAPLGIDVRTFGLKPPSTPWEYQYLEEYIRRWKAPPPAYAKDMADAERIDAYRARYGADPRLMYDRGTSEFSLWFHVTNPTAMSIIHGIIVGVAVLFTLGIGTRVTAALTWFGWLSYVHRNPMMLFGADTMITILLAYLMISPCGAALALDRVIRRWWTGKHGEPSLPEPSVSANVVIRILQIHLCMIYFIAGLAKLMGPAWWNGTAIWSTIANYEFAPMQNAIYMRVLRALAGNSLLLQLFMTGGGLFTLAFEISYIFLIWRPRLRWVFLGAAIVLHGLIGMLMGLKTFALVMLIMNMVFLTKDEVYWTLGWIYRMLGWFGINIEAAPSGPAKARTPALQSAASDSR